MDEINFTKIYLKKSRNLKRKKRNYININFPIFLKNLFEKKIIEK